MYCDADLERARGDPRRLYPPEIGVIEAGLEHQARTPRSMSKVMRQKTHVADAVKVVEALPRLRCRQRVRLVHADYSATLRAASRASVTSSKGCCRERATSSAVNGATRRAASALLNSADTQFRTWASWHRPGSPG